MGCAPSQPRRVSSEIPALKLRQASLSHRPHSQISTEFKSSSEIGTALSLASCHQSPIRDPRDAKDKEEPVINLITLPESYRGFSFGGIAESCTSVDPKEMGTSNQLGTPLKLSEGPFTFKRLPSSSNLRRSADHSLRRLDTIGENLQASQNQNQTNHTAGDFKIIINLPQSQEELNNSITSKMGLRNDSPSGTPVFREDRQKVNGPFGSMAANAYNKLLLVVPEESRIDETMREESRIRNQVEGIDLQVNRYQSEGPIGLQRHFSDNQPWRRSSVEKDTYRIRVTNTNNNKNSGTDSEEAKGNSQAHVTGKSKDGFMKEMNQTSSDPFLCSSISKIHPCTLSTEKELEGISSIQGEGLTETSAFIPTSLHHLISYTNLQQPNQGANGLQITRDSHSESMLSKSNKKLGRKNGRMNTAGVTPVNPIVRHEAKFQTQIKTKFRSNLLDLVSLKNTAAPESPPKKTIPAASSLEEICNITGQTRSPQGATIRDQDTVEGFNLDEEQEEGGGQKEKQAMPAMPKLNGLNNLEFFKGNEIVSPVSSQLKKQMNRQQSGSSKDKLSGQTPSSNASPGQTPSSKATEYYDEEDIEENEEEDDDDDFDYDRYTIVEEIKEVEIDETNGINIYKPEKPSNYLHPYQYIKKSPRYANRPSLLSKSKSANYDETGLLSPPKQKRLQWSEKSKDEQDSPLYTPTVSPAGEVAETRETLNSIPESVRSTPYSTQIRKRQYHRSRYSKTQVFELSDRSEEVNKDLLVNQFILEKENRVTEGLRFAVDKSTKKAYTVSILRKEELAGDVADREEVLTQLIKMIAKTKKLKHPNIAKLHEVIEDEERGDFYFFTELNGEDNGGYQSELKVPGDNKDKAGGSTIISSRRSHIFSEEKARKDFRELLLGVDYLHNNASLVHGTIQPENIVFSEEGNIQILGAGQSLKAPGSPTGASKGAGTDLFLPPEAWEDNIFKDYSYDIWGIGVMLYYFLFGEAPFRAGNSEQLKKILTKEVAIPEFQISKEATELIKACLHRDPAKRISLDKIMSNSWVTNNGKEPLANKNYEIIKATARDIELALNQRI